MMSINIDLKSIALTTAEKVFPATRVGAYLGAGALIGRKVVQGVVGGSYKAAAAFAKFAELKDVSLQKKWEAQGDRWLDAAKKNLAKDLALASALVATGFLSEKLEDYVAEKQYEANGQGGSIPDEKTILPIGIYTLSSCFNSVKQFGMDLRIGNAYKPNITNV